MRIHPKTYKYAMSLFYAKTLHINVFFYNKTGHPVSSDLNSVYNIGHYLTNTSNFIIVVVL